MLEEIDITDPSEKALWDLLGNARQVEASPYFARKVLRAVEDHSPCEQPAWMRWFRMALPVGACTALAMAAIIGTWSPQSARVATADPSLEFDTIANLDLLVANYESSLWLDGFASTSSF